MLIDHKNRLYKCIENGRLNPKEFCFTEEDDDHVSISYKNTPLIFSISISPTHNDAFFAKKVNFTSQFNTEEVINEKGLARLDIEELTIGFEDWLDMHVSLFISNQMEEDLLQKQSEDELLNFSGIELDENKNFKRQESELLAFQLQDIKSFLIQNHSLTGERLSKIEERMDSLKAALKDNTLTKKDWKILALSIFASIAISLDVPDIQDLIQPYLDKVQATKVIKKPIKSKLNYV